MRKFEFRVNGIADNGYTVWLDGVLIGIVAKRYGRSRRKRDHGAEAMKGWDGWNMAGTLLITAYTRESAAHAIADDKEGIRHR